MHKIRTFTPNKHSQLFFLLKFKKNHFITILLVPYRHMVASDGALVPHIHGGTDKGIDDIAALELYHVPPHTL